MRKGKKILSTVLATAMIITSIPAMNFFKGALNVNAAVTYAPKKIGVLYYAVICCLEIMVIMYIKLY